MRRLAFEGGEIIARMRECAKQADRGFTLIEIVLAMFLTGVVMAAALGVIVSSLAAVSQSRQRQTATALATQTLERLRALPYDSLTGPDALRHPLSGGLEYVSGTPAAFSPASVLPDVVAREPLVINEFSGKRSSRVIDGVTYAVQAYVTKPVTTSGKQVFNLTSIVSWTSSVHPTAQTTAQRSTAYSPPGCLSTAQHPFAGPCQAYFTVRAGLSAVGFSVSNADDPTQDIPGIEGGLVELTLPVLDASLQIEQTASGSADAATSGARSVPDDPVGVGAMGGAVKVDSDPSSPPLQRKLMSAPAQTAGPVSLSGAGGTVSAWPTGGDTAQVAAAIAADSATCTNGDKSGRGLATGPTGLLRPCASANVVQSGATGEITYTNGDTVRVLSLAAASSASRAVAANLATANPGLACATGAGASSPGCAHSSAYRSLGDLVVGSSATGAGPLDPGKGVFKVAGLEDSVVAEQGVGAETTPTYNRVGTLTVWTSLPSGFPGYQNVDLADYAAPPTGTELASQTWVIPAVTTTYASGLTVTAEGAITVERPRITTTGPTGCGAEVCVAGVDGSGGLHARTVFTMNSGGVQITRFVLVSGLGGLVAQSTYKAAPHA